MIESTIPQSITLYNTYMEMMMEGEKAELEGGQICHVDHTIHNSEYHTIVLFLALPSGEVLPPILGEGGNYAEAWEECGEALREVSDSDDPTNLPRFKNYPQDKVFSPEDHDLFD